MVSIVTPTYNSAGFIAETIECIQNQTYEDWELLITDDCSTDNTVEIIKSFAAADSRIKLFCLEKNGGGGVSRNNSIEQAQGRYIAFCDSDDRWLPDKLETQLAFMENTGAAFTYASYLLCDENGNDCGITICRKRISYRKILMDNYIGCLTAMYDTEKVGKVYMPLIRKRQDWGLWIKIIKKCGMAYGIKKPLGIYRIRKNSVSSNKLLLIKYHAMLYKEMLHMPLFCGYFMYVFVNLPSYIFKQLRSKIVNM